jgi:hypothetical protein
MILSALNTVGGARYLARQAEANPTAFMSLVGRVLPTKITNEDGSPISLHLIAATLISQQLHEQQTPAPPTINAEPANLLDAPLPTE